MKFDWIPYLKKGWRRVDFWNFPIAAIFSLSFFLRFLDFFKTPSLDKLIVLLTLFVFFFLISLFFLQPVLEQLFQSQKVWLPVVIGAAVVVALLFWTLPYENVPFRTTHHLVVSVPSDSKGGVMVILMDPDGNVILGEEVQSNQESSGEEVYLQPGSSLEYGREMTGGVSVQLVAPEENTQVLLQWDQQELAATLGAGETETIAMDGASWGTPSRMVRYFMMGVFVIDGLACLLICLSLAGLLFLWRSRSAPSYRVHLPDLQKYLLDYLILNTFLVCVAVVETHFQFSVRAFNLVILAPGLGYLGLKLLYPYFRALPMMILSLAVGLNLLAQIPGVDIKLLNVQQLSQQTFNELAVLVNPSDSTLLSVGFYKQLKGAELILSPDSIYAEEDNQNRLIRINQLEAIYVEDYFGELSVSEREALLRDWDWLKWDKRVSGSYYFFNSRQAPDAPLVFFWRGDDVFLVPVEFIDDLGLPHDFILD